MPDFLSWQFGLLILATFLASTASTAVGFGFGIILVSFFQFFVPTVHIVGLGLVIGLANSLLHVLETRTLRTDGISLRVSFSGVLGVPENLGWRLVSILEKKNRSLILLSV